MILRPGCAQEVGMSEKKITHIDNLIAGWDREKLVPAIILLVARKGVIVYQGAYGYTYPGESLKPVSMDTIFPVSSISKPITCVTAMTLVEEGRLGLNRPVREYIPEFTGDSKDQVLVCHLMTHTSGLRDEDIWKLADTKRGKVSIPTPTLNQHPSIHERLYLGYDTPLRTPPGTEMSYCNYGMELLGEILIRVSGQSLDELARQRIFSPLAMRDTSYVVPEELVDRVYKMPLDVPYAGTTSEQQFSIPSAAGGVFSTVHDLAILGQMMLNKGSYGDARVLSKASVKAMTSNQILGVSSRYGDITFPEASWGLGWSIHGPKKDEGGTLRSNSAFSHSGAGCSFVFVDPEYEIVETSFIVSTKVINYQPVRRFDLLTDAIISGIED